MRKRTITQSGSATLYQFPIGAELRQIIDDNGDIYTCTGNDPLLAIDVSSASTTKKAEPTATTKKTEKAEEKAPKQKEKASSETPKEGSMNLSKIQEIFESYDEHNSQDRLESELMDLGYRMKDISDIVEQYLSEEIDLMDAVSSTLKLTPKKVESKPVSAEPSKPAKEVATKEKASSKKPVYDSVEEDEEEVDDLVFKPISEWKYKKGDMYYLTDEENPSDDDVILVYIVSAASDHIVCKEVLDIDSNELSDELTSIYFEETEEQISYAYAGK